jgi:hypothetical protein
MINGHSYGGDESLCRMESASAAHGSGTRPAEARRGDADDRGRKDEFLRGNPTPFQPL